ncbi:ABC transporter substrate-binding protein [Iamia sp. SCSIO 61187]|uniref:ABC transporter substrate-binding protein n=1 Tax=Iamia sp. SCSIO 61187 TaxID=2722752 RepID=UPI001C628EA6|nr:ABC transporter substrate-binding protein [Iamia sp. SCSIO 61187]QYG93764.1 ABC transporter substrate-binding protein [Iamia sp. SCSIO 61187]
MNRAATPRLRLLALLLVTGLAVACSGSSNADDEATDADATEEAGSGTTAADGPWTFTDDFDVTHELDEVPETIVAEVSMAGALWDLGIEVDATFGQRELPDGTTDPLGLADPDAMESLGDVYGEVNTERLQLLDPDIIVVPSYEEGQYWGVNEDLVDDVERAGPVVAITIPGKDMRAMADRVLDLAVTLGVDPEGAQATEAIEAYETAEADLRAALEAKPGLTFMAASGTVDQLYVAVPSGYSDLLTYQELGMEIVEPDTDEQYWETLSWEQIDTYTADVLLADSRVGSVDQIVEQIPEAARSIPPIEADQVARWEVTLAPGYANLARILTDLTEVVEAADPDVV